MLVEKCTFFRQAAKCLLCLLPFVKLADRQPCQFLQPCPCPSFCKILTVNMNIKSEKPILLQIQNILIYFAIQSSFDKWKKKIFSRN